MVGIEGYGVYIPKYRIKIEEIARHNGMSGELAIRRFGVIEKSLPGKDEDTISISCEAADNALKYTGIDPKEIEAIFVGSESHPYAVKPSATIVAEYLGSTPYVTCADFQFACKAGTVGIQVCLGLVLSDMVKYAMAIGADTAQSSPGDPLEYTASAGGAAFIIGKNKPIAIFENEFIVSYTTDTPDFWRRPGQLYPKHGGRFTGEQAYFKHIK